MSEPTTSTAVAVSVASGTLTAAALSLFDAHIWDVMAAFGGCVVAQTLLPNDRKTVASIIMWSIGSITMSAIFTPLASAWWAAKVSMALGPVDPEAVRHVGAAVVAMLAQPWAALVQDAGSLKRLRWWRTDGNP